MVIIWANLDAEARWANQTLPKHVLEKISAAAVTLAALTRKGKEVELWTPAPVDPARIKIKGVTVREGVPARQHIVWCKPHAKAANDRRVALAVHEKLGTLLAGQRAITSLDELASATGPWVAKAPWTAAGRDRAMGNGPPTGELAVHVTRLLERCGVLMFEPWCERIFDLGVCGSIDEAGAVTKYSQHTLRSDARGNFVGIALTSPTLTRVETAKLESYIAEAGRALHALEYSGPFGIDAFIYRTPETELPVFIVLVEDMYEPYETRRAVFSSAHRTRAEAEAAADAGRIRPHAPDEQPMEQYHVREGTLSLDAGGQWQLACALAKNESAPVEYVVRDIGPGRALHVCEINARHTFGHVTWGLFTHYDANELGFGEPPEGARVLVEGGAWIKR
ncbi:MAG TPA: hypothetical protein VMZ53_09540 [Kofleriaceae bacterium]|nr:hypothetical protein [Kofleriaceae bacterium]